MKYQVWLGLGSLALIVGCNAANGQVGSESTSSKETMLVEQEPALADIQSAFQQIAESAAPAVVSVSSRRTVQSEPLPFDMSPFGFEMPEQGRPQVVRGAGSGFIVSSDGWIITNDHVVAGAEQVTIRLDDGREFTGDVRRDYQSDLALVKIQATGLPTLKFANPTSVKVGSWAIAYGSPFGLDETMTVGIVSALGRESVIGGATDARFYPELLQTDASINPGNSGGPLLNIRGEVIGVNVAIGSPTGSNVGIGFAIPIETAQYVMEQLIEKGAVTRGYLGFTPESLDPVDRERLKAEGGVLVVAVQSGSPAAQAGLQVEDVVTEVNGQAVTNEVELRRRIGRTEPGSTLTLTVIRSGQRQELRATVAEAPGAEQRTNSLRQGADRPATQPGKLGVQVANITPDIARQLRLPAGTTGVVVTGVDPAGPAAEAGLTPGDVILRINGTEVRNAQQVQEVSAGLGTGEIASIVVRRGDMNALVRVNLR